MGYTIGIIGQKDGQVINSQAICCESEPSELCTIFSYDETVDPWILNDMSYSNDGMNFTENQSLLTKGYPLPEAKNIIEECIGQYEKIAKDFGDDQDLIAAKELFSILEEDRLSKADTIYFVEVRF